MKQLTFSFNTNGYAYGEDQSTRGYVYGIINDAMKGLFESGYKSFESEMVNLWDTGDTEEFPYEHMYILNVLRPTTHLESSLWFRNHKRFYPTLEEAIEILKKRIERSLPTSIIEFSWNII